MSALNKVKNSLGNTPAKLSNQASNAAKKVMNTGAAIKDKVTNAAQKISNTVKEKVEVAKKQVSDIGQKPEVSVPLSKMGAMTEQFFSSNTAISTFVYFMLCLLLFVILFQIGAQIVFSLFGPQYNPYVIDGMVPSDVEKKISVDPNEQKSVPIFRSVDQPQGIEFSWNVWFMVQDISGVNNTSGGARIFSKGTNLSTTTRTSMSKYLNVSPGVFITPSSNQNQLVIVLNTFDPGRQSQATFNETITIPNIPMQKWVCCTIRVQGTYVDVYINGVLTKRTILINVPKQNNDHVYIGDATGFKGYISSIRYYAKAINYDEIQALFASGPSLKMLSSDTMPTTSDFLSMNWYYKYNNVAPPR